jgi:hypothetical protein
VLNVQPGSGYNGGCRVVFLAPKIKKLLKNDLSLFFIAVDFSQRVKMDYKEGL